MNFEESDQVRIRKEKLARLRALGIEPYAGRFDGKEPILPIVEKYRDHPREALESSPASAKIAGRIVGLRRFGKAAFAHLQDATGRLQVYFKADRLGERDFSLFELLDLGDHIGVAGRIFRTKSGELTIEVESVSLLAKSLRPLPEKWHGLSDVEIRYRQRYLDLIVNSDDLRKVFLSRAKIIEGLRRFLVSRGFLEVETPMMQPIPGGAAARPFITHHHALGIDLYLRIAPELYLKRLLVGGMERIFEINRNFRNEGISTIHNPEFTMLEFYMAFADYRDLMKFTEQMLCEVAIDSLGTLKFEYQGKTIDLTPPWEMLPYLSAIARRLNVNEESLSRREEVEALAKRLSIAVKPIDSTGKILEEIFEGTVEQDLTGPVFITDYPTEISPLARRKPDASHLTERFELYIASREIANAFSELNDPEDQRSRFLDQLSRRQAGEAQTHAMDEDFLRALEYGMPPAAGEGVGIDRLVMLLTNQPSIRDVILFPQLKPQ